MYLDFLIEVPAVKGKITRKKKGNNTYINCEYARIYDHDRRFNIPQRVTIGKESKADLTMMQTNQKILIFILWITKLVFIAFLMILKRVK